jgi:hypothetical protein
MVPYTEDTAHFHLIKEQSVLGAPHVYMLERNEKSEGSMIFS